MLRKRTLFLVIAAVLAGGLVASALETEGPNHQRETHHCAVCCPTHHAATPLESARFGTALPASAPTPVLIPSPYTELVIRLLDPPPKFLA